MTSSSDTIFLPEWYLLHYPQVRSYKDGAKAHYEKFGWHEARSPHPLFDTEWYLAQDPGIRASGLEPTVHYQRIGWREMLSPHPVFKPAWYLLHNPDILAAGIDPLQHYLRHGWKEGRTLHPLFDTSWYLEQHPELKGAGPPIALFVQGLAGRLQTPSAFRYGMVQGQERSEWQDQPLAALYHTGLAYGAIPSPPV
jgi:hypothetical protein